MRNNILTQSIGTLHPAVLMLFFVCFIITSVTIQQPLIQVVLLLAALTFWMAVSSRKEYKMIGYMMVLFAMIMFINPLFNTNGDHILFTYFGRPYTQEALMFGASTAVMFTTIMFIFAMYSKVMTSDKFTYLFGGVAPLLTLMLTMVLRLLPAYRRKASQIATARACIGKPMDSGNVKMRAKDSAKVLSAMTTWAFQGASVTADSMRSRGYSTGAHTNYRHYRFGIPDVVVAVLTLAITALIYLAAFMLPLINLG